MASRQREWQIKKQREGRCIICGGAAVVSCYCEFHNNKRKEDNRKKRQAKEGYKPQICGICGEEGHNKRTCLKKETSDAPE